MISSLPFYTISSCIFAWNFGSGEKGIENLLYQLILYYRATTNSYKYKSNALVSNGALCFILAKENICFICVWDHLQFVFAQVNTSLHSCKGKLFLCSCQGEHISIPVPRVSWESTSVRREEGWHFAPLVHLRALCDAPGECDIASEHFAPNSMGSIKTITRLLATILKFLKYREIHWEIRC